MRNKSWTPGHYSSARNSRRQHRSKMFQSQSATLILTCLCISDLVHMTSSAVESVQVHGAQSLFITGSSLFGNDVIPRDAPLGSGARRIRLEPSILLPSGYLHKYIIYVLLDQAAVPPGQTEASLRLQIWRPTLNRTITRSFVLVFQEIVTVALDVPGGTLYEFTFAQPWFETKLNDRIGWTNPNSFSVVSFGFNGLRSTVSLELSGADFPTVNGPALTFPSPGFPITASTAVQIISSGSSGAAGPQEDTADLVKTVTIVSIVLGASLVLLVSAVISYCCWFYFKKVKSQVLDAKYECSSINSTTSSTTYEEILGERVRRGPITFSRRPTLPTDRGTTGQQNLGTSTVSPTDGNTGRASNTTTAPSSAPSPSARTCIAPVRPADLEDGYLAPTEVQDDNLPPRQHGSELKTY